MMEKIKVPNSLKDKVLNAAYSAQSPESKNARYLPRHHNIFRVAVCTACAFALLSGGLFFSKSNTGQNMGGKNAVESTSLSSAYHFGVVAYAADLNETYAPQDNKLAFSISSGSGGEIEGKGDYTGCLFRVTGNGIKTVSATIDRGGFYKYKKLTNLTKDDIKAIYASEANGTLDADCQFASSDDKKIWCSEQMKALGSSFSEDWDADSSYGFWVPPELIKEHDPDEDLRKAAHEEIDTFNGATLTITATFEDGSQQTETLHLKTGKLKITYSGHTQIILPELASDDDPYDYSVYAELEN
jgi:hypothetical protein